jgi:hypothetical protein
MVPTVTADHQNRIGKAEGRKTEQGDEEQNDFPNGERVNADQNHTRYGFYSTGCATSAAAAHAATARLPSH